LRFLATGLLLAGLSLAAGDKSTFQAGPLTVAPSGFLEAIGVVRSQETADEASTRFGAIPLTPGSYQSLLSVYHSRVAAKATLGRWSGYFESDFDDRPPANPFRVRLFFGSVRVGNWELAGGQQWSLLRPNRRGVNSEGDLMNTRVVDAAYHVGLVGDRNAQARGVRRMGNWRLAMSFEGGKDGVVKLVHDSPRLHWEVAGLAGGAGRRGVMAAAVWRLHPNLDAVTQQFYARSGGVYALDTAPAGVPAASSLGGLEMRRGSWRAYGYGGLVYAARSEGNRRVTQWTAGLSRELGRNVVGRITMGVQVSRIGRSLWEGPHGRQNLIMLNVRQFFGAAR